MNKVMLYKCLYCGFELLGNKDGLNCPACRRAIVPLREASNEEELEYKINKSNSKSSKGIKVNVNIKDFEVFKSLLNILWRMVTDECIPADIRKRYAKEFEDRTFHDKG
jgi:DNA-directed RNA polymerase subunit RPC12/RpoP